MKNKAVIFAVALLTCSASATDYGQLMASKVKGALGGKATKGYTFSTYPVDNFGVATAYESKVDVSKQICATWECLGIGDDAQVEKLSAANKLRLVADGIQYASIGSGADLNLTADEKRSVGLKALLPKILQVLSISFDLSSAKEVTTDLSTGTITIRTLRRQKMIDEINGPHGQSMEKASFDAGNLVLVYSDIVVSSMKINIKLDTKTNADLEAKLSGSLTGKVGQVIGKDSSLGFKVDKAAKGDYTLETTKPLILAVYTKKQPKSHELGSQGGWNAWADADLGNTNGVVKEKVDLGDVQ
jgi:hypothetical protein